MELTLANLDENNTKVSKLDERLEKICDSPREQDIAECMRKLEDYTRKNNIIIDALHEIKDENIGTPQRLMK